MWGGRGWPCALVLRRVVGLPAEEAAPEVVTSLEVPSEEATGCVRALVWVLLACLVSPCHEVAPLYQSRLWAVVVGWWWRARCCAAAPLRAPAIWLHRLCAGPR